MNRKQARAEQGPHPTTPSPLEVTRLVVRVGADDGAALLARLTRAGVRLNPLAEALLLDPRMDSPRPQDVAVVVASVAALGLPDGGTFAQLTAAAAAQGLGLCPLALGPWLRLQRQDSHEPPRPAQQVAGQAPPGAITVASSPPPDEEDIPWGFYLRRIDGEPWLRAYRCWSGHRWAPTDHLAFAITTPSADAAGHTLNTA
jgi:hypothetical protein